jgi:hypothetical protein
MTGSLPVVGLDEDTPIASTDQLISIFNLEFNPGCNLEDLWTKLSDKLRQGLFQNCNITFQVNICI